MPGFSSRGDAARRVDVVAAPGSSIVSLRDPGSYVDEAHPSARVGEAYFKGSGSSQAAAVVSGAVALLLDARPNLTPDQVKAVLRSSAEAMPSADSAGRGAGELDVLRALTTATPRTAQTLPASTGLGSLEAARGSQHVAMDDAELRGEAHVLGSFDARTWAPRSAAFSAWSGGTWAGSDWTSGCWCSDSWTGKSWTGEVVDRQVVDGQVVDRCRLVGQVVDRQVVDREVVDGERLDGHVLDRQVVDREVLGLR